jgi:hypothetical protein
MPNKPAAAEPAFSLHPRLGRPPAASRPLERGEPPHRRLRIFTGDPTASALAGRTTVADVPYEPIELTEADHPARYACVCGRLFELHMIDAHERPLAPPDLDAPAQLMQDGHAPSESNPQFHAQMVYAVASRVHADFRRALGREPGWGFAGSHERLKVYPFGTTEENAWYDPEAGELVFGYFPRKDTGWVSTALMHDIIAHELTHALLDSQRPHFMEPTGPDVAGFHEGFADLVALFQHFQYREPLKAALQDAGGVMFARSEAERAAMAAGAPPARKVGERPADWLRSIACQFGAVDGLDALRRADRTPKELSYTSSQEEHDKGELLLSAVFDAFDVVYRRRTARARRLASGGSGVLPAGAMHPDLLDELAHEAASLARRFLSVVVRALDYCPPAKIMLGEFLRAMITADADLVPDDRWGFREALIDAFRARRIYPRDVISLTEDSLLWRPPRRALPPLPDLSFARTQFDGGPGRPLAPANRTAQAQALGRWLQSRDALAECGLVAPGDPALATRGAQVTAPCIDALEVTSHASPEGELRFHTVAVVTQRCTVARQGNKPGTAFQAGGTLLFGPDGQLRLAVTKSALGAGRIERTTEFMFEQLSAARSRSAAAAPTRWEEQDGVVRLRGDWLRSYHQQQRKPPPQA